MNYFSDSRKFSFSRTHALIAQPSGTFCCSLLSGRIRVVGGPCKKATCSSKSLDCWSVEVSWFSSGFLLICKNWLVVDLKPIKSKRAQGERQVDVEKIGSFPFFSVTVFFGNSRTTVTKISTKHVCKNSTEIVHTNFKLSEASIKPCPVHELWRKKVGVALNISSGSTSTIWFTRFTFLRRYPSGGPPYCVRECGLKV